MGRCTDNKRAKLARGPDDWRTACAPGLVRPPPAASLVRLSGRDVLPDRAELVRVDEIPAAGGEAERLDLGADKSGARAAKKSFGERGRAGRELGVRARAASQARRDGRRALAAAGLRCRRPRSMARSRWLQGSPVGSKMLAQQVCETHSTWDSSSSLGGTSASCN